MLSYRHAFHAGNHADVIKHMTLCLILRCLEMKEKPYSVVDTHAGGGLYSEDSVFASKNREYNTGIEMISKSSKLRDLVPEYFKVLDELRAGDPLAIPGSPWFEAELTRDCDRITLIDLHPAEIDKLKEVFHRDHRINVQKRDAMEAMGAVLPPTPRRGLCFIDPSYEEKGDYDALIKALKKSLSRWEPGVYAIWYPVLSRMADHSKAFVQEIKHLGHPMLQAELRVKKQDEDFGMCGSGMLVLNYPFALAEPLKQVTEELGRELGGSDGGSFFKILVPRA
jgi:23S rRNA (adenine2030-N6)-methyltransferase